MSSKTRIDVDVHSPNSPAEGSGKRRRAIVACTTCRRRKIRCDATKPFCGNCHRAGIECVYPAEARRKRPKVVRDPNPSQSDDISRRMERLEDMMKLMLEKQGIKSLGGGDYNYDSDDTSDSSKCSDDEDDEDNCTPCSDKDGSLHNNAEYNASYDDPRDVLRLQQRRAPVVFKIGEFEPFVTYSYGFTTALLSPKSMGWLCSRVGNSELGHDAETLLTRLWKKRSEEFASIGCLTKQTFPIDPELIAHGLDLRGQLKSEVFDLLLNDEDVAKIEVICNPHKDLSRVNEESPYSIYNAACALVATCFSAKLDPNLSRFPLDYINKQYTNAFNICMQKVAQMTWYPTTFLLLRLLVFVAYVLSQSAAFVQIRSILSVIIARSLTLGLHSKDLMAYLSEEEQQRRALVWALIQDMDVKMSSVLSMVPLLINVNQKPFKLNCPDPHGDLRVMIESTGLNKIYSEVFNKLFSIKARKKSTKQILMTILKLDEKLKRWKESLPSSFTNFTNLVQYNKQLSQVRSNPGSQFNSPQSEGRTPDGKEQVRFSKDICSSWMRSTTIVCYHNIRMLLYSIPAFSPSCLSAFDNDPEGVPATLRRSIDVIAECANSSLNYAFMASGFYNSDYLAMTATNSFSALFLKQVRDPRHPTNHSDLQGILSRIEDFRDIARDHRDVGGTLKLWNLFASTLKELNRNCNRQDMPQSKKKSYHAPQGPEESIALKPLQNSSMPNLPSFTGPQLPALNPQSPRNVSSPAEPAHPVHPNLIQPCPTMPLTNGYGSPSPIPMVPPSAPYVAMSSGVPFMPPPPPPLHIQRPYPFGSDLHMRPANESAYTPLFGEPPAESMLPNDTNDKMRPLDAFHSPRNGVPESSNTPDELWDTFNGLNNSGLEDLMSAPVKDDSFDGNNTGETPTNCVIC